MKNHRIPRLDVLDHNGRPLGYDEPIDEIYRRGLWHQSVQVLVYTPAGEILVQRRSPKSIILPSYLDMSAAGGVDPGETPLQAAARETKEEVGLSFNQNELVPLPVWRYSRSFRGHRIHSRAFIHPFLAQAESSNVALKLQKKEVDGAWFVSLAEAKRLVGHHRIKWGKLVPHYVFFHYLIKEVERRVA